MTNLRGQTEEFVLQVSTRIGEERCGIQEIASLGNVLMKASTDLTGIASGFSLEAEDDIGNTGGVLFEILKGICQKSVNKTTEELKPVYEEVLKTHPQIEAIWQNRMDGTFMISIPPAGIVNASSREWWQEAVKGKEYISPIYVSA
jgi:hypothetical protein